jgi:hypothetical protein
MPAERAASANEALANGQRGPGGEDDQRAHGRLLVADAVAPIIPAAGPRINAGAPVRAGTEPTGAN